MATLLDKLHAAVGAAHVLSGVELSPFKNVEKYMGRVGQRPKVQEAMKAEGLKTS